MCGDVREKKFNTCGFGLYEGRREREEERRKEAKGSERKEENVTREKNWTRTGSMWS